MGRRDSLAEPRNEHLRDVFPEFYPPDDEEFKDLSANALIVVDACVLLNLYSYSESASNEVLRALDAVKDRLWMPHQFGLEYLRNRPSVILKEASNISGAISKLGEIVKDLRDLSKQPFVHETLLGQLDKVVEELRKSEQAQRNKVHADPYRDAIARLLHARVGAKPDTAAADEFKKKADKRIAEGLPPGFADIKKKGADDAAGDAIAWLQILDHVSTANRSLILVTDDAKEDWWTIVRERTIGPRSELVAEFRVRVPGKCFHMYSTRRFLEFISEISGNAPPADVIEELREHARGAAQQVLKAVPAGSTGAAEDIDRPATSPDSPKAPAVPEKSVPPSDEEDR